MTRSRSSKTSISASYALPAGAYRPCRPRRRQAAAPKVLGPTAADLNFSPQQPATSRVGGKWWCSSGWLVVVVVVRSLGFEPRTCGLRVRCSAVELEALAPDSTRQLAPT